MCCCRFVRQKKKKISFYRYKLNVHHYLLLLKESRRLNAKDISSNGYRKQISDNHIRLKRQSEFNANPYLSSMEAITTYNIVAYKCLL